MTKQEYIQLTKQPLKLLYTHYKETNQDRLGYEGFVQYTSALCFRENKTMDDLYDFICRRLENELRVWRVYDINRKFINFA